MANKKNKTKNTPTKTASIKTEDITSIAFKEEVLRWMFTILCSFVLFGIIAYFVNENYHPDVKALLDYITSISFSGNPRPEPTESLLVKLGMVLLPVFLLGFYFLFTRKTAFLNTIASGGSFNIISTLFVLLLVVIIYYDFAAPNPFSPSTGAQAEHLRDVECETNFEFFFKGLFLGRHLLLYTFIIVPLIYGGFMVGLKKYNWDKHPIYNFIFSVPANLFIAGLIICVIIIHTFLFPYTHENKYDFNAVYYSMTQVYAGTPMLANGFTNTYGLYPHFLNLIFKVIGLNIVKFTFVLSLLLGLAFTLNYFFLKRYVSNKVILLLGITSVMIYPYLGATFLLINFGAAFSFWPIRWIIPSLLFFLTSIYLNKRSKLIYFLTFTLMGSLVLWNPEVGILSYLSWIVINVYNDFYDEDKKINIKKMLFHIIFGATLLFAIFYLYKFLIFITFGEVPDISLLFTYIILFGKTGFASLPMVLIHPWNIDSIIYLISILYVIVQWLKRDITPKAVVMLLVTLIGFGFFLYFQGRSHNFQFFNATIPCFFLLALLGDSLWEQIKNKNVIALNVLFFVVVFILSFSIFDVLSNTKKLKEQISQKSDIMKYKDEDDRIKSNENFIIKNSKENEKIHIFTAWDYQGLYFNGNKRKSAFNPSWLEVVLYADIRRLEKNIIDSSFNVFIEPDLCNYPFLARPIAAISAKYEAVSGNLSMILLKPTQNKIPTAEFFKPDNFTLLHRKYSSDSIGIKLRIDDSQGIPAPPMPEEFSIELLFRPQQQIYQYATLIGNMTDSAGLIIANNLGSNNYFFGINGKTYNIPVINKGWVYCVLNVFKDRIEIYQNGNLTQRLPLEKPYKNSNQQLFIGNIGAMRYYLGQIAEVAISKKAPSNEDIHDKWLTIEKTVNH